MLRFINTDLASAPHACGEEGLSMLTIGNMTDFPTGAGAGVGGH